MDGGPRGGLGSERGEGVSSLTVNGDPVGLTPCGPGVRLAVSAIVGWPSALPLGVAACRGTVCALLEAWMGPTSRGRRIPRQQRELEGLLVPPEP